MALASFAIRHVLILVLIAATAWAAGRIGTRALRLGESPMPPAVTVAIGFALLAQAGLLLGLVGWLRTPVLVSITLALHIVAIDDWRAAMGSARLQWRRGARALMAGAAITALGVPLFLPALYPPLGFDQTLYHLPTSRAFAASGGVPFLPALRLPVFPHLAEVLDAWVLLLAGDVATQFVGWLALVACIGLVFVWTRELSSPAGGWVAAATLAGSPFAFYLASTGYVEPLLALCGLAALYAAVRAREESSLAWIVASGALAGTAAGVKYLGLFYVAAAPVLLLSRIPWRIAARHLALYGLSAAVALAPSYGRVLAHTGNPLFPFYPELFGTSPWFAPEFLGKRGMERLLAASTLLWDMTFRRHDVGGLPPLSPAFAIGLPVVLAGAWQAPALRRLLLLAAGYVLVAPVSSHYFLGIAPLWSVLIGAAAARLFDRREEGRRVLLAVAIALALGGEAYAVYRVHRLGLPPATEVDRARLLAAEVPLYPAIAFLNHVDGRAIVYGVDAEHMVYYATGTLLGDLNGPASYQRIEARVLARGSLAAALDEIGAAYFLVPSRPSAWTAWAAGDPRLQRIYGDRHATVYRVLPAAA
jgi:4-amino-4-deoxy-L-arabinose transferase-like glycosyltransferase